MVENYVSPACYVTEIELEGVLCLSAQHEGISSGGNDDLIYFGEE